MVGEVGKEGADFAYSLNYFAQVALNFYEPGSHLCVINSSSGEGVGNVFNQKKLLAQFMLVAEGSNASGRKRT